MKVLVISVHPDDETLGCGGTLLREKKFGSRIHWINITCISEIYGWKKDEIITRKKEIKAVSKKYKFNSNYNLDFPTTKLDMIPLIEIIKKTSETGKVGDGKIFISDIDRAIRIRTGETQEEAL